MRFEWIQAQKKAFSVTLMRHNLQVTRSGYYAYLQRKPKTEKNPLLVESVKRIHKESKESYGSSRISEQLCSEGYHVGRVKAKSLMKKAGTEFPDNGSKLRVGWRYHLFMEQELRSGSKPLQSWDRIGQSFGDETPLEFVATHPLVNPFSLKRHIGYQTECNRLTLRG